MVRGKARAGKLHLVVVVGKLHLVVVVGKLHLVVVIGGHRKSKRILSKVISMPLPYKLVTRRTTKNSQKAPCALSLDSVLKKHRQNKRLAAPDGLVEPDPLRDHLSDPSDLDDITPHSDKASEYDEEDEKNKQTIQTESGELAIQKHGLLKA